MSNSKEISQLSSFINVDDVTKNIGITSETTPYVGIGTTNPTSKLTVSGDVSISGVITASSFVGEGSGLTGIIATGTGVEVQDDGSPVGTASTINFGDNLTVDFSGGVATIDATGGGTGGGESYWEQTSAGIHTLSNVGIGTTNPTETLTVVGDARVTGILTIGTSSITLDGNTDTIVTQSVESNVLLSNDVNVSGITTSSTFSTGENGILITQNDIFSDNLVTINSPFRVVGNFFVDGEQTVINTSQLQVTDKLINLGNIEDQPPSNITADGGGIILKGTTDKLFLWSNFTNSWSSNVNINIGSDDAYKINNEERLSYNQLNVPNANITGVITASQYTGNGSGLSGIVTSIIAGSNINISSSSGQVTISAAAVGGGGGEGGATGVNVYDSQGFIGFASAIDFGDNLVVSQLDVVSGFVTVTGNAGGGESTQWRTTSVGIHTLSNVGIGTTNPTSALTVSGNARFTGIVTASSFGNANASSLNVSGIATISQGRIQANGSANLRFGNVPAGTGSSGRNIAIGDQVLVSLSGGQGRNIGIGELSYYDTTTGQYNIGIGERAGQKVTTGAYNVVLGAYDGNSGGLDIRTSSRNVVIADGEGNIRQYINSSGNVGIKTTVVTEALTVAGIVSATGFYGTLNAEQLTGTLPAIDGSALIGVVGSGSGVIIEDDATPVGTAGTINFGTNLNVSFAGGTATVSGVSSVSTATTAFNLAGSPDLNVGVVTATTLNVTGDRLVLPRGSSKGIHFGIPPFDDAANDSIIFVSDGVTNFGELVLNSGDYGTKIIGKSLIFRSNFEDWSSIGTETSYILSKVGIGTTLPTSKLDVTGDVKVSGIVTATSFSGSGSGLTNLPSGQLTGTLPAIDGSALLNVTASGTGVVVEDDQVNVGSATTIDFGTGLDVTFSAGIATITATGGEITGIATDSERLNGELSSYYLDYDNFTNTPLNLSDFNNDVGFTTFSSDYGDLTNTPLNLSDFNNDVGFITSFTDTNYWTETSTGIHTLSNVGIGTTNPTSALQVERYSISTGIGTFNALVGVAHTFDSFDISQSNYKTVEYTVHIENESNIQSQKVLILQNGTNVYSQEYAIMFVPSQIVSIGATISSGVCEINLLPSSGISGLTSYTFSRGGLL